MKTTDTTVIFIVDGMDYALDIADLTGRESGILKRIGHIEGPAKIPDAMNALDTEVLSALAGIAMARAGIKPNYERLLDLPVSAFGVKLPDSDNGDIPLAGTDTSGTPSLPECTE